MNIKEEAQKTIHSAEEALHAVPEMARDAQARAKDWRDGTTRFLRENPGVALAGAFVIGFALAKVARHV